MNYLSLVQRLRQECDIAGTGPTTVLTQTGDYANLVNWLADAWIEIQNRHQWKWLRRPFSLQTTVGVRQYAYTDATDAAVAISRFSSWYIQDNRSWPKIYLTTQGTQRWMTYIEFEDWQRIYDIGTNVTTQGAPSHITVNPQNELLIGPVPNDTYTITGEYFQGVQRLALDADIPELPDQYHMLLVYQAMEDFGYHQVSPEALARSTSKASRLMRQLELNQMFMRFRKGVPLA